jgi:hypothetical protein
MQEYMQARHEYDSALFKIVDGVGYVCMNGIWREASEVPSPRYEHPTRINPNSNQHIQLGVIPEKSTRRKFETVK